MMEATEIERILDASERLIADVDLSFRRYLCGRIDWEDRLICIKGPKGCGKTTLMLQHIKECFDTGSNQAVYLSLDHIWFSAHDVLEVVDWLCAHGTTHLFLDEVHHAQNWAQLVKTIFDFYPKLHLVYSGSSVLKLTSAKADLSRRQAVYDLKGMSFREFLEFETGFVHPVVSLGEILSGHRAISRWIVEQAKVLPLFGEYLRRGYYPFGKLVKQQFSERLAAVVTNVLDVDFPAILTVTAGTIKKAKKMLMILSESCPQTPNMSGLYRELETDRNAGIKILEMLESAELLALVSMAGQKAKLKRMGTTEKIFLGDTNLMHALVSSPQTGALRETYFANQLRNAGHTLLLPEQGDFLVDDHYLFEIGGKGKSFNQIKDIADSFVASDDIEVGVGNRIPLWLFGFLY